MSRQEIRNGGGGYGKGRHASGNEMRKGEMWEVGDG